MLKYVDKFFLKLYRFSNIYFNFNFISPKIDKFFSQLGIDFLLIFVIKKLTANWQKKTIIKKLYIISELDKKHSVHHAIR